MVKIGDQVWVWDTRVHEFPFKAVVTGFVDEGKEFESVMVSPSDDDEYLKHECQKCSLYLHHVYTQEKINELHRDISIVQGGYLGSIKKMERILIELENGQDK